ncbi:nucleocapsid protein [M'Poko virus]|uniref:Nucleoprotein n=1 Tax=M'Poko virus TaxID=442712 RepID=A5CLH0_9VIRU|nr:nucleocapsid protein [M'Poko virus]CAM97978.1 nucleocapsid protein [M'Poko virus]
MIEVEFHDVADKSSTYDPEVAYAKQKRVHTTGLSYDHIRILYKRRKNKTSPTKTTEWERTVKLGDGKNTADKTNFPGNSKNPGTDDGPTPNRLRKTLPRYLLKKKMKVSEPEKLIIKSKISNQGAEKNGINGKDGEEINNSFIPGTEMFLGTFRVYPLAIGIYKVKSKEREPKYLEKTKRQRNMGQKAANWTVSKWTEVQSALTVVSSLGWKKTNVSAAARDFLAKFGINIKAGMHFESS